MMTTINATLNEIINASITCKAKDKDTGKYNLYATTALKDNFKHTPKAKDCTSNEAKSALNALGKVYEYLESASSSTTSNQRDNAVTKAHENAKTYLNAIGMAAGIGDVTMLCSVLGAKKQTTKGIVKGGYTTRTTFTKYVLFLSYQVATTGSWCVEKTKSTAPTKAEVIKDVTFLDYMSMSAQAQGISVEALKKKFMEQLCQA